MRFDDNFWTKLHASYAIVVASKTRRQKDKFMEPNIDGIPVPRSGGYESDDNLDKDNEPTWGRSDS